MFAAESVSRECLSRWFVRCRDCLAVVAVEVQPTAEMRCGACEGKLETMGRVTRSGTMVTGAYDAPACDARCTHARGPSCDCPCGGANHGTGATVPIVQEASGPRVKVPAAAARVAAEWRAELDRVRGTRPGRIARLHADGQWVNAEDYGTAQRYRSIVAHARSLRTHRARMRELSRVQEHGIGAPVDAAPVQGALF